MKKWSTMTLWLLVSAAVMGCGGASDAHVPPRPARWIAMDDVTYAFIGREALEKYGYDEIIRLGVEAGFLRYPEQTNAQNFVGQTLAEAASQAWPVFTKGAVMASITALMDSPAPGPADAIAIGMLFAAIAEAGYVGVQVWTSSTTATATPVPTVTPIPTTTAPPNAVPTTTTTAPPIAVPTTTTTAPPIAVPRKYPNQTCDNARLKTLQKLKDVACDGQKWTCSNNFERIGKPGEKLLTCAEILVNIPIGAACVAARKRIQTECFVGSPDPTHEDQLQNAIKGLAECVRKAAIRGPGGGPCTN